MRWLVLCSFPLLASAWILFLFSDSATAFVVAALIGAAVGLWGLYFLLKHPTLIRFANVLGISLLLGYALGTSTSALASFISQGRFDPTANEFGLLYRQADISYSLMFVVIASVLLFIVGAVERPVFSTKPSPQDFTSPKTKFLLLVSTAIVLGAFALGDLDYMGTAVSATGNITALGALSQLLAPVLLPLTIVCILQEKSRVPRVIYIVLVCVIALALFPLGRRVLIYSLVTCLFAFVISGKRLSVRDSRKWLWIGIGAPMLLGFIVVGFYFFFALRLTVDTLGPGHSLPERVTYTLRVLQVGANNLGPELASNVASRPFILSYLAGVYAATNHHSLLMGQEVTYAMQNAVPSLLFPNKTSLLPAAQENFIHPALGIPVFDGPQSIVTAGLDDFGVLGLLGYPIVLALLYALVRRAITRSIPPVLYYLVVFRLLYQLLYVEQSLSGMFTTGLRDLALITLVLLLLWKACGLRLFHLASRGQNVVVSPR
jgi:hypothetical protein